MLNLKIIRCDLDLTKTIKELGLEDNAQVKYEFTVDIHGEDVYVLETPHSLENVAAETAVEVATNTSAAEDAAHEDTRTSVREEANEDAKANDETGEQAVEKSAENEKKSENT